MAIAIEQPYPSINLVEIAGDGHSYREGLGFGGGLFQIRERFKLFSEAVRFKKDSIGVKEKTVELTGSDIDPALLCAAAAILDKDVELLLIEDGSVGIDRDGDFVEVGNHAARAVEFTADVSTSTSETLIFGRHVMYLSISLEPIDERSTKLTENSTITPDQIVFSGFPELQPGSKILEVIAPPLAPWLGAAAVRHYMHDQEVVAVAANSQAYSRVVTSKIRQLEIGESL